MAGRTERVIQSQRFDFGELAASEDQIVEVTRNLRVEGSTEGLVEVAVHAITFGSASQLIEIRVFAVILDADQPEDFVAGSPLAAVSIRSTTLAGMLLRASFQVPFGGFVRVEVRGRQPLAASSTFDAQLTVQVALKRPPDVRMRPEMTRTEPARELVPLVLRARACAVEPEPDHVPFRYVGRGRLEWPWPVDAEAVLRWLPEIIEHDRCACDHDPEQEEDERQAARVFEQLVMRVPESQADDPNVIAFGETLAAEPVAMTRCCESGDLVVLWDRWSKNGPGPREGALAPRGRSTAIQVLLASATRIRGGPAPVTVCARPSAAAGEEEEFALGFSTRPAVHGRGTFGVDPELLPAVLDELHASGWRPTSVTRHGSQLAPKYAMTVVRDDLEWRAELTPTRGRIEEALAAAVGHREVPTCMFERWGGGYGCIFTASRHRRIAPAHVEWGVTPAEFEPTLRAFACDGWRIVSLGCASADNLDVVWTRDLWADSRFRGIRQVAS